MIRAWIVTTHWTDGTTTEQELYSAEIAKHRAEALSQMADAAAVYVKAVAVAREGVQFRGCENVFDSGSGS